MRSLLITLLVLGSQASLAQDREWYNLESYHCVLTNGPYHGMEVIYEGGDQVKMVSYGDWYFPHVGAYYDTSLQQTRIGFGDTTRVPSEASDGFRIDAPLEMGSQEVSAIYYHFGYPGNHVDMGRADCTVVVGN